MSSTPSGGMAYDANGLMAERIPCKTPGCSGTVLLSTAEETGGFCRPCVNRRKAEERRRYIEANRIEVDPFAAVSDIVEVLRLVHNPPPPEAFQVVARGRNHTWTTGFTVPIEVWVA